MDFLAERIQSFGYQRTHWDRHGAPERIEFSGIAAAMLSVGVVIISSDLNHLLGKDAPVQRSSATMTSTARRLYVILDMCAIGAAATLPAIVHFLYRGVVDHRDINWASAIGGVVLAAG